MLEAHSWKVLLVGLCALYSVTCASLATAGTPAVDVRDAAIVGTTAEGYDWRLDVSEYYEDSDIFTRASPAGPVRVGERVYVGVGADLLTIHPEDGIVVERTRFPAEIDELRTEESALKLVLTTPRRAADGGVDGAVRQEVQYVPGRDKPDPGLWSNAMFFDVWMVREITGLGKDNDESVKSPNSRKRKQRVRELEAREQRDPTNPYLPLARARLLAADGRDAAAREAFARAAELEAPTWAGDVVLGSALARDADRTLANRVLKRADTRLRASNVDRKRLSSLMLPAALASNMNERIELETKRDGYAAVDRWSQWLATLFPSVEHSDRAYRSLADWLESNGQPELSASWRERERDFAPPALQALGDRSLHRFDAAVFAMGGLGAALVLASFFVGLHCARRRPDTWLPRPRVSDVAGLLLLVAIAAPLPYLASYDIRIAEGVLTAPVEISTGGYASPNVIEWLGSMPNTQARDAWLDHARASQDALERGERFDEPAPASADLARIIESRAQQKVMGNFPRVSVFETSTIGDAPGPVDASFHTNGVTLIPSFATTILVMLFVGLLIGRTLPRLTSFLTVVIPGAAPADQAAAAFVAPLVCAITMIGLVAGLHGFEGILTQVVRPTSELYFGQGNLPPTAVSSPLRLAFVVTLAVGVVGHATLWLKSRDADRSKAPENTSN